MRAPLVSVLLLLHRTPRAAAQTAAATPTPGVLACTVATVAGSGTAGTADGLGTSAQFRDPFTVSYSPSLDAIYVASYGDSTLRLVSLPSGAVTTLVPSAGGLTSTTSLMGVAADAASPTGNAFFALGCGISLWNASSRTASVIAGATATCVSATDGVGTIARFFGVEVLALSPSRVLYMTSTSLYTATWGCRIRALDLNTLDVTTLAGGASGVSNACGFADSSAGTSARFSDPRGIAWHPNGNLYIGDMVNCRIRVVSTTPPFATTTLAGSGTCATVEGTGTSAQFDYPRAVVVDPFGGGLFAMDSPGILRSISLNGVVRRLAGIGGVTATSNDGPCLTTSIGAATGLTVGADGRTLYYANM